MKSRARSVAVAMTSLAWVVAACSLPRDEAVGPRDSAPDDDAGDGNGSSSGGGSSGVGSSGGSSSGPGSSSGIGTPIPSACRAGFYAGTMTGSYFPGVDSGGPLSVQGNVELTLNQVSSNQGCTVSVAGEGLMTEFCGDLFTISGGTMAGVLTSPDDAGVAGLAYSCTLTGVLACATGALVNGWIQCSYCAGAVAEAGACTGTGGFAGPVLAGYDTLSREFVDGAWNGAEALAGNDGGTPGPEGGPYWDYLALDGGYGNGAYGGSGAWSAACTGCP